MLCVYIFVCKGETFLNVLMPSVIYVRFQYTCRPLCNIGIHLITLLNSNGHLKIHLPLGEKSSCFFEEFIINIIHFDHRNLPVGFVKPKLVTPLLDANYPNKAFQTELHKGLNDLSFLMTPSQVYFEGSILNLGANPSPCDSSKVDLIVRI